MEQKLKDISKKAEDLSKKISKLQDENTLPIIELDIILLDIRTLYEEIKNLQTAAEGTPVEEPPHEVPRKEDLREEASPVENHQEAAAVEVPQEEVPIAEVPQVEVPIAEVPQEEVPIAEVPPSEASEKSPELTTLADRYKGEKRYINESLAGNIEKNDISSKIQSKPIQHISSALGLNDRFKLINDLFNGDKDSFQNTISVLDTSSNFNEAFTYINSSFDWDMEEDSVQLLLELVRRKFIVNQDE